MFAAPVPPHQRFWFLPWTALGLLVLGCIGCNRADTGSVDPTSLRGEPIIRRTNQTSLETKQSLAVPQPAAAAVPDADGFVPLGFDVLSGYVINIPDEMLMAPLDSVTNQPSPNDLIPANVRQLNGQLVSLEGFMLPLKVEGGLVTELLLMKDQSQCCYGVVPKINEWVSVRLPQRGVKPLMDVPVTLHGKLHVGPMVENGYLVGIYSMDGEKMTGPLDQ